MIGVLRGKAVAEGIETFGGGGILGAILVATIIAIALIPFFGFVELSRLMDRGELARNLLHPWTRNGRSVGSDVRTNADRIWHFGRSQSRCSRRDACVPMWWRSLSFWR